MRCARPKIPIRRCDFLQSTYEAAATAAKWDRDALESALGQPGVVRQI